MDIIKRMKKDRDYRYRVILLVAIGIILFSQFSGEKKEAKTFEQCHIYNTAYAPSNILSPWSWHTYTNNFKHIETSLKELECKESGCYVAVIPKDYWVDHKVCVPSVPDGWAADTNNACESGCMSDSSYRDKYYLCVDCGGDAPTTCNSAESAIASVIQSMGLFKNNCKTAYYTTIILGIFLALIIFAAM